MSSLPKEDQDVLHLLVQHVARAFYEPRFTIVLDQLIRHPVYVLIQLVCLLFSNYAASYFLG